LKYNSLHQRIFADRELSLLNSHTYKEKNKSPFKVLFFSLYIRIWMQVVIIGLSCPHTMQMEGLCLPLDCACNDRRYGELCALFELLVEFSGRTQITFDDESLHFVVDEEPRADFVDAFGFEKELMHDFDVFDDGYGGPFWNP